MPNAPTNIRPMTGGCGAEVLGIDLARDLSEAQWSAIRNAYHRYGVIFFRDQTLSPDRHLAFARRWGTIDINRFFHALDGHPEIAIVEKDEFDKANVGGSWHTDHSYDEVPAMGSILVARELPETGGDTMFANMYGAYEALSDGLKRTLAGMRAIHSAEQVFGPRGLANEARDGRTVHRNADLAAGEVTHPVVIRHPETGRPALYVNPIFTLRFEGWTAAESRPLLDYLYSQATRPELTCRFRWARGSIAFWDNRSTWHFAVNDYHGQRRLMHRITVAGSKLSAFQETCAPAELQ